LQQIAIKRAGHLTVGWASHPPMHALMHSSMLACLPVCRALARLTKLLRPAAPAEGQQAEAAAAGSPLSIGALVGVVQPLLLQMIVEGKAGDDNGHEQKQADRDRGANVTDAAVVALGAVAGVLPWVQYQQLLGQHLRLIKRHAGGVGCGCARRAEGV
jgi:U3 small nucleolar RNA-associated protein 20